jgi:hypothetical protein
LEDAYRGVRSSAPSRLTLFENSPTLLQFIPFDYWQHLMQFMLNGGILSPVQKLCFKLGIAVITYHELDNEFDVVIM